VRGSEFTSKAATLQGKFAVVLRPLFAAAHVVRRRYLAMVPWHSQAVTCGAARCALQVLDRGAQADARGATHLLDRGVQAISRGVVVCKPLPTAPLVVRCMYMAVVPGPIPAAVASRCCRRRFQQVACACGS